MKAVIMAGGKGTRIRSVNSEAPKPMIPILGKPILEYQIENLKRNNITDIILVTGYLGHHIKDYFGTGGKWNVSISYIEEDTPLGTAGALYYLKDNIEENFLLINGDIIFDIDFNRFCSFHEEKGGIATLFTHPNSHPYDSAIIVHDEDMRITKWYHKEDEHADVKNCVNAGIHIFSPQIFSYFTELKKVDLDRDILRPLLSESKVYAYTSPEYVKDMGTPDRYHQVEKDISSGVVARKNLSNKQKAIFLDRDGTINKYKGFITKTDEIELIDNAAEAIKAINSSEYLAIVITNQPVIARGDCTVDELEEIHNRLETLLGEQGAYVDAIYYCPHHPDKGFEGEISELKIECECRKPKPGLIFKAANDFNIDLSQSYMIGDSMVDVDAGQNAGCKKSYLLEDKDSLAQVVYNYIRSDIQLQ